MKRLDYYCGIILLASLLLIGNYGLRYVSAQSVAVTPKVVTAQEFRIVDSSGRLRSRISVEADGSLKFRMMDKSGQSRVVLGLIKDNTAGLTLNDALDTNSFGLSVSPDGPGLSFESKKGAISMTDMSGGPGMIVLKKGGPRTYLDSSGIVSVDKAGDIRAIYGTDENGNPSAAMLDEDKTTIWAAPKQPE